MRGRRATLGTSIDVRGSLAANWVGFGAAIDCGSSAANGGPMDADGLLRDRHDAFSMSGSICVCM